MEKSKFQDFIDRITSYKTTIIGAVTAIAAILVLTGVLKPENQGDVVSGVSNFWDGLVQCLAGISGLILIFSHDSQTPA